MAKIISIFRNSKDSLASQWEEAMEQHMSEMREAIRHQFGYQSSKTEEASVSITEEDNDE